MEARAQLVEVGVWHWQTPCKHMRGVPNPAAPSRPCSPHPLPLSTTMDTPAMSSAAALKLEIERLKGLLVMSTWTSQAYVCFAGAINQRKSGEPAVRSTGTTSNWNSRPRHNVYVNPNYKPPAKTHQPSAPPVNHLRPPVSRPPPSLPQDKRDVVIDGVAFESSGRSLVRKDCE